MQKIIEKFGKISKKYRLKSTIKFQFRELNSFIHKEFKIQMKNLSKDFPQQNCQKKISIPLKMYQENKMLTSCTPLMKLHDLIETMKFDTIKIASVSSLDFNL